MNFPRLLLPAVALLVFVAGCATNAPSPSRYTKLRVSDVRGHLIAEWTARGQVSPTDDGYRITAVERTSAPPHSIHTRYPDGWKTRVAGPNIERWECGQPLWLYEWENGEAPLSSK